MAINLGGGFHIGSKQAIDDRLILTKDEMLNINENTFPDVYMCVCSDDGAIYTFNINNEINAETGKFRMAEGGSNVDCYTKSEIDTKLDDYTKTEDLSTVIIDDTNTEATDKTLSSSKIESEIQSIIDDTKATENNVLSAKYMLNNFEPRKEFVSKEKLTYSTNYIRAYCDYSATIPATVRITDDNGSVLLITGSDSGSWRAVRLIKSETDRFKKVYYSNGYVYIQVDNDSMYTVFGGVLLTVVGSATGTEIPIENAADTDIEIPTNCTADSVSYVNNTIGSATVEDALNTILAELHTHNNKEVLDLLSENNSKLQYNGSDVAESSSGANTAGSVEYVNDVVNSYTVEEALNKLIADFYYVESSITSFTASPAGGTYEVGTTISSPTFNWAYNKNIITQSLTDCTIADETVRTATYNSDITTNKTFTLVANDGRNNVSSSISYKFVYPYYVGVATTNTLTETDVTALTKKVEAKGNKTINYTTSQSYMVFAYPMSYGDISKIIDQNGFDVSESFTQSTVNINGTYYYVRCSNKCSGSYSMTFKY